MDEAFNEAGMASIREIAIGMLGWDEAIPVADYGIQDPESRLSETSRGLAQGALNVFNSATDVLVGFGTWSYNLASWGMNKLGAENPYVNGPDWSKGLAYDENGQHEANREPGNTGANAAALALVLPKALGNARLAELPGMAWNGAKNLLRKAGDGWRNLWGGGAKAPKPAGAKGLIGKDFEDFLAKKYNGTGSFSKGGRDFDGSVGNRWWEAKSGRYWEDHATIGPKFEKFKSDMGDRLRIAQENGATYELHSNAPIPQHVKDYLTKKGIPFFEHLE